MTRITRKARLGATLLVSLAIAGPFTAAGAALHAQAPAFEVDPGWPQALPNDWIVGLPLGIYVDSRDQIWVVQNAGALSAAELAKAQDPPVAECCVPAPAVLVFDTQGKAVQSWSGEGVEGWPTWSEKNPIGGVHGVFVDHRDNVWIATHSQFHVMKFTRDGRHLLTIGEPDSTGGSNDPDRLGGPADIWVNPATDEVFVADGYRNRRVVVYDGETGRYLRHWGAYGKRPDDQYRPGSRAAGAPPSEQFSTPHGLIGSRDGLLYVADRSNSRIQVFRFDGTFVMERNIAPGTLASGAAFDVALSPDPEQRFLYVADGTNNKVRILRRGDLQEVGSFGRAGRQVGQFTRVHNIAVDSRGNIYTTEAADGRRIQRFVPRGGGR
jgi:sugar lactone lactonase YvrE